MKFVSKRKLSTALACCLLICGIVYAQSRDNFQRTQKAFFDAHSSQVLVAAHRGAHKLFPENSLAAIEQAIKLGVDIVEIDIRLSRDGVPVLMHDQSVDRTTNGKGKVEDLTLGELKQLYLIDRAGTTTHKVPTLKEALELAQSKIMVDLDLKTDKVEPIMNVVKDTDTFREVFFFDSDYRVLQKVRDTDKRFTLMPRAYSYAQTEDALKTFNPPVIHIDPSFYTQEVVALAKGQNARIWINALGDVDRKLLSQEAWKSALFDLLKHGASIVQTDEPEAVLAYLRRQSLHW